MRARKVYIANFVLFLICSGNLISQVLPVLFQELSQANGLSELRNSYISEDSKGYIWIGGFDGLNRFDGKKIKVYRPVLPNGTYSPTLTSKVIEDKKGNLWFSTSGALHCILPESDSIFSLVFKNPDGQDNSNSEHVLIHVDSDFRLWTVAHQWLHVYNITTGKDSLAHPINTFSAYPLVNKQGKVTGLVNLLAAAGAGIEIFDYSVSGIKKSTWFTGKDSSDTPKALILFASAEGDSLLWLPSDIGLIRFPVKHPDRSVILNPPTIHRVQFREVFPWKDRFLFVASANQGLLLFDKHSDIQQFTFHQPFIQQKEDVTEPSSISNLFVGHDGALWLSVWGKGVFYSNPSQIKFQTQVPDLQHKSLRKNAVTSVIQDKAGNIWTASDGGDIIKIAQRGKITLRFPLHCNKLFCDQNGDIWAFNSTSVFLKRKNTFKFNKVAANLNRLYGIKQMSANDFLFICPEGVFKFSKDMSLKNYSKSQPFLAQASIFDGFLDSRGRLFLSDEVDKIWVYKNSGQTLNLEQEINGVGYSNGMSEYKNIRWFASNKGLFKLDINNFSTEFVKGKNRILERAFNAILPDNSGNLWLSSNAGLFKYNPTTEEVKHYTLSDGLQGLQFMPGSACKLSDGRLAFGGVNGLNIFHPDSVRDNPDPPVIHFTDWVLNDTGSIGANPEYLPKQSFSYFNRTLSFYFVGIDYTAPDEVQYKYRLKGFEKDTVDGGTTGFARYAQIPAGDYTFQVWAANSDGVWTTRPRELHFTILPPWYATWWARGLQVLLLFSLFYTFYRNRIAQVRRKESERRKEAEFRQKEAESKQLAAELQNSVLRLQMNPHFIFNSMNSISSYILQKDIDTANDYLGRFARLMRLILDLAAKRFIPVADEIELLEQYMSAETMRFEQKFTWAVELDEQLDPDEIRVPTMILQPFVENAIWHGFSGKPAAGHIRIGFRQQAATLYCTVEDNGVGRGAKDRGPANGHHSTAIQITEQRLQLIAARTSLDIIDLYDEIGAPAGTRVVITLPLDL